MELRYYVEHIVLPTLVKDSAQQLITTIGQNKEDFLEKLFASAAQGLQVENTFTKDMFHIDLVKYKDEHLFQVIKMPLAEVPPYCDFIIIKVDESNQSGRYFTLEKATGTHLLCEWKDDRHYAYGKFSVGTEDPLQAILEICGREVSPEEAIKSSAVQKALDEQKAQEQTQQVEEAE